MNTQIINTELALALRKCLPFVRRHAIISGGDGAVTYAFAMRALADADARQQEEAAVKNIVEAEQARRAVIYPSYRGSVLFAGANAARDARLAISAADARNKAARAVRPSEGYLPAAPPARGCDCDTCTEARLRGMRRAGL